MSSDWDCENCTHNTHVVFVGVVDDITLALLLLLLSGYVPGAHQLSCRRAGQRGQVVHAVHLGQHGQAQGHCAHSGGILALRLSHAAGTKYLWSSLNSTFSHRVWSYVCDLSCSMLLTTTLSMRSLLVWQTLAGSLVIPMWSMDLCVMEAPQCSLKATPLTPTQVSGSSTDFIWVWVIYSRSIKNHRCIYCFTVHCYALYTS